jgi:hypothetical protein
MDAEDPFVQCRNVTPIQRIDTAMEVFEVVKALRKQAKGSRTGQPASCGPDLRSLLAEKIERFADAWLSVGTPIDLQELEYLAGRLMELVEDPDSSIWLPESEWPEYVSKVFNGVANAELKLRDIAINVWRTDAEWLHRWLWRTVDGEELTDFPDAAAEVSEVSAADEGVKAPAAPEAGGEFARATDKVPAEYCDENGEAFGPLEGSAKAVLRAFKSYKQPRREDLLRLHQSGEVWVRELGTRSVEVFFRSSAKFREASAKLKPDSNKDKDGK